MLPADTDVALLGTGVAPLVAAMRLIAEGKSVLLLNPDLDFFLEDSELPLDPMWPIESRSFGATRLLRSTPEEILTEFRPEFPGAIELWPRTGVEGFHDESAPHVRARNRLWIQPATQASEGRRARDWDALEALFVEASDAGMKPQILDGLSALSKFPGFSPPVPEQSLRAMLIPKICDVDVPRYRNGLLEFLRDRLDPEQIVCDATQIDLMPEGLRFHAGGVPRTARVRERLVVFWTPRLTQWVHAQAKKYEAVVEHPRGVRIWEQWSLVSRDALDAATVGAFENMSVWAEVTGRPPEEGADAKKLHTLSVLRAGPLVTADSLNVANLSEWEKGWASSDSFRSISRMCHDFLGWDKFSIRSVRTRAVFEWDELKWFSLGVPVEVVGGCDGPLIDVVRQARDASDRVLGAKGAS